MKLLNKLSFLVIVLAVGVYANGQSQSSSAISPTSSKNIETVNKFLNIVLLEKNKGQGLEKILAANFKFDDPYVQASSANEFIAKNQHWFAMEKTYKIKQQIAKDNYVISIYSIFLKNENKTIEIEIADLVEFDKGKMVKEKLYFDPKQPK